MVMPVTTASRVSTPGAATPGGVDGLDGTVAGGLGEGGGGGGLGCGGGGGGEGGGEGGGPDGGGSGLGRTSPGSQQKHTRRSLER